MCKALYPRVHCTLSRFQRHVEKTIYYTLDDIIIFVSTN